MSARSANFVSYSIDPLITLFHIFLDNSQFLRTRSNFFYQGTPSFLETRFSGEKLKDTAQTHVRSFMHALLKSEHMPWSSSEIRRRDATTDKEWFGVAELDPDFLILLWLLSRRSSCLPLVCVKMMLVIFYTSEPAFTKSLHCSLHHTASSTSH